MTDDDARDDAAWFSRSLRRYRARIAGDRIYLIRRRGRDVFLRTWTFSLPEQTPDTDKALRVEWFAAWSELDSGEREKLVKRAREAVRGRG